MRRIHYFIILLTVVFPVEGAHYTNPVKLVKDGLYEYEKKGIGQAIALWEIDTTHAIITKMLQAEEKYGKVRDCEILDRISTGTRTMVVFTAVNYEFGPLYIEFHLYNSTNNWIVLELNAINWSVWYEKRTALQNRRHLGNIVKAHKKMTVLLEKKMNQESSQNTNLLKAINLLSKKVQILSGQIKQTAE